MEPPAVAVAREGGELLDGEFCDFDFVPSFLGVDFWVELAASLLIVGVVSDVVGLEC